MVARYTYDAWGNVIAVTDEDGFDVSDNAAHVANANPFRYRGYYYDAEIGMYYLQSRYYDPEIGRFLNSDYPEIVFATELCTDSNLFAYCGNAPTYYFDLYGYARWLINIKITKFLTNLVDLAIVVLIAFFTCLAAVKMKITAFKIVSWLKKNAIRKKLERILTQVALLIVDAIHTVVYKIANTVPDWALNISVLMIVNALLDFIELSPAEILLGIIDRYDGDGESGYIRAVKI